MKILILFTLTLFGNCLFPQIPEIEWQNTIGGIKNDQISTIEKTFDGGFILGGSTYSDASGDKSENGIGEGYWVYDDDLPGYVHFNYADIWIVKLDAFGNIEWENTIGGDKSDLIGSIIQTADGGYIIGSYSHSGISGDKTNPNWDPTLNTSDYWVIKLNGLGSIEWQKTIGGTGGEELESVEQTMDGGYILGGISGSGISGNKTEIIIGGVGAGADLWVLKLDSIGNIQWQNDIGGPSEEWLRSIHQTTDGGFIVGAYSRSNIGGDKTENCWGDEDYWVLKLSPEGIIEWQKTIGGSGRDYFTSLIQTSDDGYLVAGFSRSGISGLKTEASDIYYDYWVLKLDLSGNIEWQNTIGGERADNLREVIQTSEGNYILVGSSNSTISGDKTEDYTGEIRNDDYWIIYLNDVGNIIGQKTIGGILSDTPHGIVELEDGSFVIAGNSFSPTSYDKSEDSNGEGDYWVIKFNCFGIVETCNTLDDNCNGLIDDDINYIINISAAGPTTFCQGGSVILNATTSGPNYQWKKNGTNIPGATSSLFTVTTKGTYSCETSSACDTELSTGIFVNVQKNPPTSITAGGATTFCAGGSVILTANTGGGLSYQWYKDASLIPGATSINYTATTAGFYKCNVTKTATGCNKNSNGIMVTVPCKGGEELSSNSNFTIFPNPNNGTFNLVFNSQFGATSLFEGGLRGMISLQIFNSLGQQIYSQQINSPDGNINETISINNLSNGIYFVRLNNGINYSEQKLIIE